MSEFPTTFGIIFVFLLGTFDDIFVYVRLCLVMLHAILPILVKRPLKVTSQEWSIAVAVYITIRVTII